MNVELEYALELAHNRIEILQAENAELRKKQFSSANGRLNKILDALDLQAENQELHLEIGRLKQDKTDMQRWLDEWKAENARLRDAIDAITNAYPYKWDDCECPECTAIKKAFAAMKAGDE